MYKADRENTKVLLPFLEKSDVFDLSLINVIHMQLPCTFGCLICKEDFMTIKVQLLLFSTNLHLE